MDTLSRKHRLRQHQERRNQQQQQQQQQLQQHQVSYGKENHRGQFEEYELDCAATVHNNNNHMYASNNNHMYASNNNNNNNNNNRSRNNYNISNNRQQENQEEDEEEFEVFKVIEIRKGSNDQQHQYIGKLIDNCPPLRATNGNRLNQNGGTRRRQQQQRFKTSQVGEYNEGGDEDEDEDEDEEDELIGEDFSIVCMDATREQQRVYEQQQQVAGKRTTPIYATNQAHSHHCSTDTARSTGDSSGFLSEGSGGTHQSLRSIGYSTASGLNNQQLAGTQQQHHHNNHNNHHHQQQQQRQLQVSRRSQHNRQSRASSGKLIEDLDHLMADVLSGSSTSPTESYVSCADTTLRDSTLTRGRELDYSTLCRDEFSSFIAVESKLNGHRVLHPPNADHLSANNDRWPEPRKRQSKASNNAEIATSAVDGVACGGGGPMLIGVHDMDNSNRGPLNKIKPNLFTYRNQYHHNHHHHHHQATCTSSGSSDTDLFEASTQDEIRSSSSCLSTTSRSTSHYEQSLDRELIMCTTDGRYSEAASPTKGEAPIDHLEAPRQGVEQQSQLSIHLNRIDSIRRLAEGDKSVTMEDLFGHGEADEIFVSEEYQTVIKFAPLVRDESIRVVQEIEFLEMPIDCGTGDLEVGAETEDRRSIVTTDIINGDFRSKLSCSALVWPQIDWPPASQVQQQQQQQQQQKRDDDDDDVLAKHKKLSSRNHESLSKLEELLLSRLLSADDKQQVDMTSSSSQISYHNNNKASQNLVNIVRRQMSEFIDSYVSFQSELKSETSYASDWHQNWLFAYKRPNDDDDNDHYGESGRLAAGDGYGYGDSFHKTSPKRAKMSLIDGQAVQLPFIIEDYQQQLSDSMLNAIKPPPLDLIRYSTLKLSKRNAINLHYLMQPEPENDECSIEIDQFYEAQEDRLSDLCSSSMESSHQTDVCQLLLMDSFENENELRLNSGKMKQDDHKIANRLVINYSSSLMPKCDSINKFHAHGYLFELPNSVLNCVKTETRLALIRRQILAKMLSSFKLNSPSPPSVRSGICDPEQRVQFLVNLTNVELVNDLPVIQFCAKVSGSLPISVSWFSGNGSNNLPGSTDSELCVNISSVAGGSEGRNSFRVRQNSGEISSGSNDEDPSWPIEMHANYDYEYRNKWGSWYRFRRCHGDLLFEIRGAKLSGDYNKTFRCVVQNHCSREECSFTLRRRGCQLGHRHGEPKNNSNSKDRANSGLTSPEGKEAEAAARRRLVPVKKASGSARDKHALLRTWSQRTMPRPAQPQQAAPGQTVPASLANANELGEQPAEPALGYANEQPNGVEDEDDRHCGWPQTIGRRSALKVDGHKFGQDFPYHPENLLKRLEENKFLVKCNPKSSHLQQQQQQQQDQLMAKIGDYKPATAKDSGAGIGDDVNGVTLQSSQVHFADSFEPFTGASADEIYRSQQPNHYSRTMDQNTCKPQIESIQQQDGAFPAAAAAAGSGKEQRRANEKRGLGQPAVSRNQDPTGVNQMNQANSLDRIEAPKPKQRLRQSSSQMEDNPELDCEPMEGRMSHLVGRNRATDQHAGLSPGPIIKGRQASQQQQVASGSPRVELTPLSKAPATTGTSVVALIGLVGHHHHQATLAPAAEPANRRLNRTDTSQACSGQKGATMELEGSNPKLEECKPRTNVKSLISRFSLT